MAETTRKMSKREEMAKNGVLQEAYTQTSFVKFVPAYGIDKVKLSFVKIGSNGKGFDIYIDIDRFDLLCDDILDNTLKKSLADEKPTPQDKYPYSFKYTTGNDGEKEVRISKGQKAEVNIYGKNRNEYMNIPMSYDDLRIAAKWFKRTSQKRFDTLTNMILEALNKHQNYHLTESDEQNTSTESTTQGNMQMTANETEEKAVTLKTSGIIEKIKEELYAVNVVQNNENKTRKLYFNKASIISMGEDRWERMKESCKKSIRLDIKVKENKGDYLFLAMQTT